MRDLVPVPRMRDFMSVRRMRVLMRVPRPRDLGPVLRPRRPLTGREALGGDLAPGTDAPSPAAPRLRDLALGAATLAAFTAIGVASGRAQSFMPGEVAGFLALTVALVLAERRPALHRAASRGLVPLARLLLRHMGLLFVPAGVAGVHGLLALPSRDAGPVLLALVVSTVLGLAAAARLAAPHRR